MSRFGQRIRPFVQTELDAARRSRVRRDPPAEFARLERHANTGGANVSPFRPMPVAPELQHLIDAAGR